MASSRAIATPCAHTGPVACAASPMSTSRPWCQSVEPHLVDGGVVELTAVAVPGRRPRPPAGNPWPPAPTRSGRPRCPRPGCGRRTRRRGPPRPGSTRRCDPRPDHAVQQSTPGLAATKRQLDPVIDDGRRPSTASASRIAELTPSAPITKSKCRGDDAPSSSTSTPAGVGRAADGACVLERGLPREVRGRPAGRRGAHRPVAPRRARSDRRRWRRATVRDRCGTPVVARVRRWPAPRRGRPARPAPAPRCRAG